MRNGTQGILRDRAKPSLRWASQVVLMVKKKKKEKSLPVQDLRDIGLILGSEDPLEEGMVTYSTILAWSIPGLEEPGGLQSIGL